jgi:hypothetical protein
MTIPGNHIVSARTYMRANLTSFNGLNRRNLFFSWRLGIYGRDLGIQQIAQRPPPLTTWSVLSSGSVSC